MRGVTIKDRREDGTLGVELIDILHALGPEGESASWTVSEAEGIGSSAHQLHSVSDTGRKISGTELRNLATDLQQVIDGVFTAYRAGEGSTWVVIRAIDSSEYDVESDDEDVLSGIRRNFKDVALLP